MKKIKILFIIMLFALTGCFRDNSMENIKIVTSAYPIEYIVNYLYGNHSTITSIYPKDDEIINFEVTDVLLKQYSDNDLFIFNGNSKEKEYIKELAKNNNNLLIIDVASNINYKYSMEELWLDPNNLLTVANNIRKGFKEYIDSTYLINEIDQNYENLKIQLTNLDGKYYSTGKKAKNSTIIVSDDSFKFLEKYGINVISLDKDTVKDKDFNDAKELLSNGSCKYIIIKYKEELNDDIKKIIDETGSGTLELYTMTNLKDVNTDKIDYIGLMNQNLEILKQELYR